MDRDVVSDLRLEMGYGLASSVSDQVGGEVSRLIGFCQDYLDNRGIGGLFQPEDDERIVGTRLES